MLVVGFDHNQKFSASLMNTNGIFELTLGRLFNGCLRNFIAKDLDSDLKLKNFPSCNYQKAHCKQINTDNSC